jgi:peptidoglycan-associated lipoprotein
MKMNRTYGKFLTVGLVVAIAFLSGCNKQKSTLQQTPPKAPPVDTSFKAPEPMKVDTSENAAYREAQLEAELQRLVQEKLKAVYFEYNSFRLSDEAISQLGIAGQFLKEHETMRVLIEGNCDERGSAEYNMGLGENRARVVKEYLVNYGLPGSRIEITSYGKERLAAPGCSDDACHAKNRRDEFKVIAK